MISLRRIAETGIIWSGVPRLAALSRRGRTLVLAYHNIVPDGAPPSGDRSLHLAESAFGRQLDTLADLCDVVRLASLLAQPAADARPRVIITFDDAYHGALTLGRGALQKRDLPATVFVPPAMLGRASFWWDAYAGAEGLPMSLRAQAIGALSGDDQQVRAWAAQQGLAELEVSGWLRPGNESELRAWAATRELTVAPHTWRHANLTRLPPSEALEELERPLGWLRERFSSALEPWITYPYGLATVETAALARQAGYKGGLLVEGGWGSRPVVDPFLLPRLNVPSGISIEGFRLRLAGLFRSAVAIPQQVK
jgi:peptidoglycan/xylan/chitin deacetylase (PgdA/CDA1 family)